MRAAILLLLIFPPTTYPAEGPRYLPSIWQRWDTSDLVCTGVLNFNFDVCLRVGVVERYSPRYRFDGAVALRVILADLFLPIIYANW